MYTDLFLALLNRENARGHPILSALAYAFCPAAARWWLAGADPLPPFDPVWQSLQDLASGGTLMEHLKRYGFGDLTEDIKTYVQEVQAYRSLHPIQAPEILPLFRGGKISVERRFGSQNAIDNLGGDWRNLFLYIRAWAFLLQDWRGGMKIERNAEYRLSMEKVALALNFTRLPVLFDTLVWRVPVGHAMEVKLGLLTQRREQDALRFSLLGRSSPPGRQPWPNRPAVFALDRESGEAQKYNQTLAERDLERTVQALANLAKDGPHPPLNALSQPSICRNCGYLTLCFKNHSISPHALSL